MLRFFAAEVAIQGIHEHKFKDALERKACLELTRLLVQLGDYLNINTSLELLKKSELIKVEYKLMNQKCRPIIQQNKYILVPAYDWLGNKKDVAILQEHEIGSNQYILSVGSSKRNVELKYAYNN